MLIRVDPASPEPLFAQVVAAVKHGVATGRVVAGDKLPSVRELARELVINPNTIARAYQVLESEGITHSRRGSGTFIADRRVVVRPEEQRRRIREGLAGVLADAVHLGLTEHDVRELVDESIAEFRFDGEDGERDGNHNTEKEKER